MNNGRIARNLRKPKGKFGKEIGEKLEINLSVYKQFEEIVDIRSLKEILEIGYGPGLGIKYFTDKYSIHIDGIDYSKEMYTLATKNNEHHIKDGKVFLERADIKKWETTKTYNLIYFFNVIYFFDHLEEYFNSISKHLMRNGIIGIFMDGPEVLKTNPVTMTSIFKKYPIEQVKSELARIGCKSINIVEHNEFKGSFYIIGFFD